MLVSVLEPAWPGPDCVVLVRGPDGPRRLRFHGACDQRRGDTLWIRPASATPVDRWPDPFVAPQRAVAWLSGRSRVGPHPLVGLRQRAFERGRSDAGWGLLGAALLGHRRALAPRARAVLSRAGLGHLVAISGLHVGLLGAGLWRLADRLPRVPRRLVLKSPTNRLLRIARALLMLTAALAVLGFVWASGHGAPAVRASLGLGLVPLARWRGRSLHGPTALGVVATAMMIADPHSVLHPSFQLSFAAMAGIVRPGVPKTAWTVSRDVAWATSGIAVWHFGAHALWGMALNLVAVPVFASCLVPAAINGAALTVLGSALASWPWRVAHGAARLLLDVAHLGAALPVIPLHVAVGAGALWVVMARSPERGPPRLGVLGLAVAALGSMHASRSSDSRAVAFGSPRSPGVVVVDPEGVCIDGTGPGASRWGSRLDALAVGRSSPVRLEARQAPPPHWLEAREAIRAAGWKAEFESCTPDQQRAAQRAREGLEQCRRRHGAETIFDGSFSPSPCVDGILVDP